MYAIGKENVSYRENVCYIRKKETKNRTKQTKKHTHKKREKKLQSLTYFIKSACRLLPRLTINWPDVALAK